MSSLRLHLSRAVYIIHFHATLPHMKCSVSCLFPRLARTPHQNVLGALSMDDDSDLMPILLPKARCDLGSYINSDTHGLGDKLRRDALLHAGMLPH